MSTKILVCADEYAALKKAASRPQRSPSPEEVPEKIDEINREILAKPESEDVRQAERAELPKPKTAANTGSSGDEGDKGLQDTLSFLPKRQRGKAVGFIREVSSHPEVDLRHGIVFVKGKKAGHMFQILLHFFGSSKERGIGEKSFLSKFLHGVGKEKKKKTPGKKQKKSVNAESRKKKSVKVKSREKKSVKLERRNENTEKTKPGRKKEKRKSRKTGIVKQENVKPLNENIVSLFR